MNVLARIGKRLAILFHRDQFHGDLDEEMAFHRAQLEQEFVAQGMTRKAARKAARRQFGNTAKLHEQSNEVARFRIESVWQDLRYAARQLWMNPGFTVVITLTLALSIGANSAIFSVIHAVLLKPLPYPEPDRLMRIFLTSEEYPLFPLNPWDFHDYRERNKSFESLAAYTRGDVQLSGSGEPVRLYGFGITAGYFHTLGLRPEIGREFDANTEIPGNGKQIILSDSLWRSRFEADPQILGRKITLDMQPYTVVGVMPPGTRHPGNDYRAVPFGGSVDAWWPFVFEGNPAQRGSHFIEGIGRLRSNVTQQQASAEMNAIMKQIGREHGGETRWQVLVTPLYHDVVGSNRTMLLVLLGAVFMVLLIACANAANLLLARAAARQREIAVRLALGAPRSRLVRQMLTESVLVAMLGGALGALLAVEGVKALVVLLPSNFPRAAEIHVNGPVFLFTFLISLATGVVFGLAPALQASHADPRRGLHEGGRSATGSKRQRTLRNVLVVGEVSLACVLLIGAGLMLRSFLNQLRQDPGFRSEHVLTANIALPNATYKKGVDVSRFYDRLMIVLASIPGVQSAGAGSDLPWTGYDDNTSFNIEGKQPQPHEEFHARYHCATPDYFRALGIPLIRGRFFTQSDGVDAQNVIVVNQATARRYWPNEDAVGKRITFDDHPKEKDWYTIVGVVGDVKDKPNSPEAAPAFWWSLPQVVSYGFSDMALTVRSDSDQRLLADAIRNQVRQLDPTLALANVRWMDKIADEGVATPRLAFFLVGLFAALAIILAAIGTYGVISYTVSQRFPEFGLRLALGASAGGLLRLVLAQAMQLALAGAVLGLVVALALARLVQSLFYKVSAADPLTFAAVGLMVVGVALVACYIPARRATKANPMEALRAE